MCENNSHQKDNKKWIFPYNGGTFKNHLFINTCSVDVWLSILKAAFLKYPQIKNKLFQIEPLVSCITSNRFNKAKMIIAEKNNLAENDFCFNFYGNEASNFVLPFLSQFMEHIIVSECDNGKCTDEVVFQTLCSYPCLDFTAGPISVENVITSWFSEDSLSQCQKLLTIENHDGKK